MFSSRSSRMADTSEQFFVGRHHVAARAGSEHRLSGFSFVVAVGEAGAREHRVQIFRGFVGDKAEIALFNARSYRGGNVFGALHSALDFSRSNSDFFQLVKIGNQAVNASVNDDDFLHSIDEEYDEEYDEGDSLFEPVDVSEPRAPIKELDVIEEALAVRRRDWVKSNRTYIFAGVGLVVVILIVLLISLLFRSSNPMSRFTSSLSNNFGTSFQFELQMTEDDKPMMSYSGSVAIDRSKHTAQAVYEADYNSYQYTGTVYADRNFAKKGSYYDSKSERKAAEDNYKTFQMGWLIGANFTFKRFNIQIAYTFDFMPLYKQEAQTVVYNSYYDSYYGWTYDYVTIPETKINTGVLTVGLGWEF